MNSLVITIILGGILMVLVVAGLAIGLMLTGKSRLRRGCGYSPDKKKNGDSSCSVCGNKQECIRDEHDSTT